MKPMYYTPEALFEHIRPGTRVTINVPNGRGMNGQEWKEMTGKAMICNHLRDPDNLTVALNMGGKYGTPGLATVTNIVAVGNKRNINFPIGVA